MRGHLEVSPSVFLHIYENNEIIYKFIMTYKTSYAVNLYKFLLPHLIGLKVEIICLLKISPIGLICALPVESTASVELIYSLLRVYLDSKLSDESQVCLTRKTN